MLETNQREFRAWFGLGQAYSLLRKPTEALFYFKQAKELRPEDPRMWLALGNTFVSLNKTAEARISFLRAINPLPVAASDVAECWRTWPDVFTRGTFDARLDACYAMAELFSDNESEQIGYHECFVNGKLELVRRNLMTKV